MHVKAQKRLAGALQFIKREGVRHQFEDNRTVFQFRAKTTDRCRQNAAMIKLHGHAQLRCVGFFQTCRVGPTISQGFAHKPGFIKKLIAFQRVLFIPSAPIKTEGQPRPVPAFAACQLIVFRTLAFRCPILQQRQNDPVQDGRASVAPVFPWEILIPAAPTHARAFFAAARQSKIANRHDVISAFLHLKRMTTAVSERVELLHIAQANLCLFLHPGAQPNFHRPVGEGIEGTKGQRIPYILIALLAVFLRAHHNNLRKGVGNLNDRRVEIDDDRVGRVLRRHWRHRQMSPDFEIWVKST